MPREKTMANQRTILSMPADLKERIRRFRFDREFNTEAEAIRFLIERGLEAEGHKSEPSSEKR